MGKNIENQQNSSQHLEEAIKNYRIAAKYHEAGNHEQAEFSVVMARNHTKLAAEA